MTKKLPVVKKKFGGPQEGSGRPLKEVSEAMVYKLAQTMLSEKSIGIILECSEDTLQRRFSGALHRGRENRKQSLVEAMWQKALDEKDCKMMIWLSKQHLGYKDTMPEEATQISFNVYTNEVPK